MTTRWRVAGGRLVCIPYYLAHGHMKGKAFAGWQHIDILWYVMLCYVILYCCMLCYVMLYCTQSVITIMIIIIIIIISSSSSSIIIIRSRFFISLP